MGIIRNPEQQVRPTLREEIITDADRCVKCAVCLPHCPTYAISGDESESPRGRIALMRAYADGSLSAGPGLNRHLDQCLTCRNCEPVCPANVPYGRLIDHGRELQRQSAPAGWLKRLGLALVGRRRVVQMGGAAIRWMQTAGLARLVPAARRLPRVPPVRAWAGHYAPKAATRGRVGLFVGCVASVLDRATLEDAVRVLNAAGYGVEIPKAQTCCGALHRHAGRAARADQLGRANRRAFGDAGVDTVISTATGCGAELAEHVFGADRHADIAAFLEDATLDLEPLPARIAVHAPCTQRNVLRREGAGLALLRRIPGAEIVAIPGTGRCCGAAGSYVLEHGDIADRLGRQVAEEIAACDPDYVASPNIGCAMHLSDHLGRLGLKAQVGHPVSLVARQLGGV